MVDREAAATKVAAMIKAHHDEILRLTEAALVASRERLIADVLASTSPPAAGDGLDSGSCKVAVGPGMWFPSFGLPVGCMEPCKIAAAAEELSFSKLDQSSSAEIGYESQTSFQPGKDDLPSLDLETFNSRREEIAKSQGSRMSTGSNNPDDRDHVSWCRRQVESPHFETFYGALILSSAAFILFETEWQSSNAHESAPVSFFLINAAFSVLFAIELALRMAVSRATFLRKFDGWTALDVLAVSSSLFELFLDLTEAIEGAQASHVRVFRLLRSARILRVIRIARMVQFIRALRSLMLQIASAMRSLAWSVLLLLLVVFMFAIAFTQSVNDLRRGADDDSELNQNLIKYWSSCGRSGFTLFAAMFGGIGWDVVVLPLEDTGPFTVLLFIAYVSFVHLALLNVMTGAFCQNAIDAAARDQELVTQTVLANKHFYINQLEGLFNEIDADRSGGISIVELEAKLDSEEMRAYFDALELDTTDVWTLFKLMDSAEANEIDADEFIFSCLRLKGPAKGVDMARLIWDHSYMAKRLHRFIKRTDDRLDEMHRHLQHEGRHSPGKGSARSSCRAQSSLASSSKSRQRLEPPGGCHAEVLVL